MGAIDTNVLLRWLLADVAQQAAAADSLISSGEEFYLDDAALIELVFVLQNVMHLTRSTIHDAVGVVSSQASIDFDRTLWQQLADAYVAHPKLSIVDLYLCLKAQTKGAAPLYTFDRKLANHSEVAQLID